MSEIWQSDLSVKMKQKRSRSTNVYDVLIKTTNDDVSMSPHLIFSLPRNSKVDRIRLESGFDKTPYQIYGSSSLSGSNGGEQVDGYIKFDFRNLKNEKLRIKISISEVGAGWKKGYMASAFVFSITPEVNKKNNIAYLAL